MQDGSQIHPLTLYVLAEAGLDDRNLRSKHVSEFYSPDAPKMDFVFTVCDAAASNDCAPWPGNPMTAHWGVSDPVTAQGGDAQRALAFTTAYSALNNKITAFAGLAPDQLDRVALQHRLDDIGRNQKSGNYDA
jgi:arsenate reductase